MFMWRRLIYVLKIKIFTDAYYNTTIPEAILTGTVDRTTSK